MYVSTIGKKPGKIWGFLATPPMIPQKKVFGLEGLKTCLTFPSYFYTIYLSFTSVL